MDFDVCRSVSVNEKTLSNLSQGERGRYTHYVDQANAVLKQIRF